MSGYRQFKRGKTHAFGFSDWDEEKHPRDGGKFAPKGVGAATEATSDWSGAETPEQAQAWAAEQGVATNPADKKTGLHINSAIADADPEVIKQVSFIGDKVSLQGWAEKNGVDIGDIPEDMGMGAKRTEKGVVIVFDPEMQTADATRDTLERWPEGWVTSKNQGDMITHELAHIEADGLRDKWSTWEDAFKENQGTIEAEVSRYAASHPEEAWSEIRVLQRQGKQAPLWAEKAMKSMGFGS